MEHQQNLIVEAMISRVEDYAQYIDEPIPIPYYRNDLDFLSNTKAVEGEYHVANANARLAAQILIRNGYKIKFQYPKKTFISEQ